MLVVESYNQTNITYDIAYAAALVVTDAFKDDFIRLEYRPRWLLYNNLPRAPYAQLLKYSCFRICVEGQARSMYMNIRKDPRCILYLTKDTEKKSNMPSNVRISHPSSTESSADNTVDGKYIACGTFVLPEYYPDPPQQNHTNPLIYILQNTLLGWWFRLKDIWAFKSFTNQLAPPNMLAEYDRGSVHCQAISTPERLEELDSMDTDQLSNTSIPNPLTYVMNCFVIVQDEQGKGLARKVMDGYLDKLKSEFTVLAPPRFRNRCPPKFGFFSSPAGRPFYLKYGFNIGAQWDHLQPSGALLQHTLFFMNL